MSNVSKEDVRKLVDFTRRAKAQTQEEISIAIGYGKNYISEILSPSGKPTQKFYDKLKAYANGSGELSIPTSTAEMKKDIMQLRALVKMLTKRIIQIEQSRTGKSFEAISDEINEETMKHLIDQTGQ